MKKKYLVLIYVISLNASKTVFIPRSITTDPTFDLNMLFDNESEDKTFNVKFGFNPFFISSTSASAITKYFVPCDDQLYIREDATCNIASPWLYLLSSTETGFSSNVYLKPEYKKRGVLLSGLIHFPDIWRGLWLQCNIAPLKAFRKLNVRETSLGEEGVITGYQNTTQALSSFSTNLFKNRVSIAGIDDIQLKMGFVIKEGARLHFDFYGVGIIPTSNKQTSYYFAEPYLGNGGHGGIGIGMNGSGVASEDAKYRWRLLGDIKYFYLFEQCAKRCFDLYNGDWSRYLLCAFEAVPTVALPLLPEVTNNCLVNPRGQLNFLLASEHLFQRFFIRYGVNVWLRQSERLKLFGNDFNTLGIFDLKGARQGNAVSASKAQIWQTAGVDNVASSDSSFVRLTNSDINPSSAALPDVYTFKLFAGCGYLNKDRGLEFGLHGFYEWANYRSAMNQWGLWLTTSFYFI